MNNSRFIFVGLLDHEEVKVAWYWSDHAAMGYYGWKHVSLSAGSR